MEISEISVIGAFFFLQSKDGISNTSHQKNLLLVCLFENTLISPKALNLKGYCGISALTEEEALCPDQESPTLTPKALWTPVPLPLWVFEAIKRTFPITLSPIKTPHGNVRNVHLIELSLIPSNCVIRMDEITLNATWLNTDRGGQGECLGLTIHRILNRQSDGGQQRYCFMHSNEIPPLLLLQMNYVCVTVLICDRHHLWGNVGHMLMHNKGFPLYSHPQLWPFSSRFLFLIKPTIQFIWSNCCHVRAESHFINIQEGSCCPRTFTQAFLLGKKNQSCGRWPKQLIIQPIFV